MSTNGCSKQLCPMQVGTVDNCTLTKEQCPYFTQDIDYQNVLNQIKAAVAKEIFAEIEKYKTIPFGSKCEVVPFYIITELKKKYGSEDKELVELPCKIGDEKFAILPNTPNTDVIVKGKVCAIIYQNEFLIDFAYKSEEYDYTAYTQLLPEELFDTYEEAEAKLHKMVGESEDNK